MLQLSPCLCNFGKQISFFNVKVPPFSRNVTRTANNSQIPGANFSCDASATIPQNVMFPWNPPVTHVRWRVVLTVCREPHRMPSLLPTRLRKALACLCVCLWLSLHGKEACHRIKVGHFYLLCYPAGVFFFFKLIYLVEMLESGRENFHVLVHSVDGCNG